MTGWGRVGRTVFHPIWGTRTRVGEAADLAGDPAQAVDVALLGVAEQDLEPDADPEERSAGPRSRPG